MKLWANRTGQDSCSSLLRLAQLKQSLHNRPTNLFDIGDRYVLVGRGRDFNDVPPFRRVYAGQFGSKLFVSLEITRAARTIGRS